MIIAYLKERPTAADTLDGIAHFWISRVRIQIALATVARVLGRLTEAGVLECSGSAENPVYRLTKSSLPLEPVGGPVE